MLIMRHEIANRLQTVLLSSDDLDEISGLHELSRSTTPYGFLAARAKDDFREIFRRPDDVIAAGIRDNGRLVAYSICHRVSKIPYSDNALLSEIEPKTSIVYHGDGTVVHPNYQGRAIAQRIARLRMEQIAARRIDHVLGLIAVDNIASIGNAVLAGALLVGFARDETALNYVAYAGRFRERLRSDALPIIVGWTDHDRQRRLFAERRVVSEFHRRAPPGIPGAGANGDRQFGFRPTE